MWLSGQQKRPADCGEGQVGIVTVGGGGAAVLLDSERRGLETYAPAGYRWTPQAGQRVLVIRGQGEIPCIVGVRRDSGRPDQVKVEAEKLALEGDRVTAKAESDVVIEAEGVRLEGQVYVKDETLEELIIRIASSLLGG